MAKRTNAKERFPRELEILRHLADCLPQIVWVARPDGSHEYYNWRWYEFTGRKRGVEIEGWSDLFHPDDTDRADQAWATALRSGNHYEIEFRLKRATDGVYRWFLGRAVPFRDAKGEIVNWFGTCTDIHSLKVAQDALRTARDEIEQESHQKDEFLGMVSHELRTPLNAVFGWTRLMQENLLSEAERVEAVNSIMRNAEAQGRLIEDVLDITRIVNQKLSLNRRIHKLGEIARAAVEAVRPSASVKAVSLKSSSEGGNLLVDADRARLQQVVLNLLTNAVKFTPPGGEVRVEVTRAGEFARIEVSDTGKGIAADQLAYIFERFRRGDNHSTRRSGGLGLGLAIAHQLVVMHGGRIEVQSDGEGRGSRFTVLLPIVIRGPAATRRERGAAANEEIFPAKALRGLHVMVVDDNESVRDLVGLTLTKCGASVTVANSAQDALRLMPNLTPDVVVSDIAMPDADGYEFVRKFRALTRSKGATVPVIALTAYGSEEERRRALQAGFDHHLSKPIDPTELVRTIVASRLEKLSVSPKGRVTSRVSR